MTNLGLSAKLDKIEGSVVFAVAQRAKDLQRAGKDIVDLSLGEPDFNVPENLKAGIIQSLENNMTHYTDTQGIPELRKELALHISNNLKMSVDADQIMICSGCKLGLFLSLEAVIDPGDELIVIEPAWVSYRHMVTMMGGNTVSVKTDPKKNFVPDLKDIAAAITPKTKAILVNSPCNPTGRIMPRDVMDQIVKLAKEHNLWLLSDEIYSDIVFEKGLFYSALNYDYEKIIVISGFSKNFAMTGLRVGYIIAKKEITKAINKLHGHVGSCAPSAFQYGLVGKIEETFATDVENMRKTYEERRALLEKGLKETMFPYIAPQGAFYLLLDISPLKMKSFEAATYLLEEYGIAMVPGIGFGETADDFLRISFATSNEQLLKALERLKSVKVKEAVNCK